MTDISINIDSRLYSKLAKIARDKSCSAEDCFEAAVREYIENCEDIFVTDQNAVNNLERSFFFSAGE